MPPSTRLTRRSFVQATAALGLAMPVEGGVAEGGLAEPLRLEDIRPLPSWNTVWQEKPVTLGLRKQLLVDDHVISQWSNIHRELAPMNKANDGQPLITADKPWENVILGAWLSVVHDGDKFRMWYCASSGLSIAYAESKDGIAWKKPKLGLYDFDPKKLKDETGFAPLKIEPGYKGGKDNNLIGDFGNGFTCFLDSHETDPAHRYKACYGPQPNKNRAVCLAHSSDGLRWTPYNDGKPVLGPPNDCLNQVLWDESAKVYRFYGRHDYGAAGGNKEVRGARLMTNPDIKKDPAGWKLVRNWLFDREPYDYLRRQVMSLTNTIYEGIHLGLLCGYEWPTGGDPGPSGVNQKGLDHRQRHERDVAEVYLVTSRDGDHWDLSWVYAGKPLVWRGREGAWDKDYLVPATTIVTWEDKHWLYYGGFDERNFGIPSRSGIGLATAKLDRFVYLEPWIKEQPSWIITKPFKLEGSRLEVNADARQGELRVEVLKADDAKAIRGFSSSESDPLKAQDELRFRPRWTMHAHLATLRGKIVRLKFHLRNVRFYAFQVNT